MISRYRFYHLENQFNCIYRGYWEKVTFNYKVRAKVSFCAWVLCSRLNNFPLFYLFMYTCIYVYMYGAKLCRAPGYIHAIRLLISPLLLYFRNFSLTSFFSSLSLFTSLPQSALFTICHCPRASVLWFLVCFLVALGSAVCVCGCVRLYASWS